jgi:hypothetical protein
MSSEAEHKKFWLVNNDDTSTMRPLATFDTLEQAIAYAGETPNGLYAIYENGKRRVWP